MLSEAELQLGLQSMEATLRRKLLALCAERAQIVFDRLAISDESRKEYANALESLRGNRSFYSKDRLSALPESDCDDPHSQEYLAMLALGVLFNATAHMETDSVDTCVYAMEGLAGITASLDAMIGEPQILVLRAGERGPIGAIELAEDECQRALLRDPNTSESLARHSSTATLISRGLDALVRKHDW